MTNNIVELKTRTKISNESVISLLEQYLEMAKEGDIVCIALAGTTSDNSSWTAHSELENAQTILGSIEVLKAKILNMILED